MGDTRDLYRTDFHAWTGEQAAALRTLLLERPNLPIDLEHLIEEVEDLGSDSRARALSFARLIIQHLLLLEHSPALDQQRHWTDEVDEFRAQLDEWLSESLRNHLEQELDAIYARARKLVVRTMSRYGEPTASLPRERPYSLDQIVTDWFPPGVADTDQELP
jgi:hypothetical protein